MAGCSGKKGVFFARGVQLKTQSFYNTFLPDIPAIYCILCLAALKDVS